MSGSRLDVLRWQFDLVWSLLDYHLDRVDDGDFLWQPVPVCWTVRPAADGRWVPDWVEPEPDPPPPTTVGWLSWHIGWWWTVTIAHVGGRRPPAREEIAWPGDAQRTVAWLRGLRAEWARMLGQLTESDLDAPATFPWHGRADRTVEHTVAWVNAELMKNAAEIGQFRHLRAASPH